MVNLKAVADYLTKKELWTKPLSTWGAEEIEEFGLVFLSCPGPEVPVDGWKKPTLSNGKLKIPFDVHPSYRWWTRDGKALWEILDELGATKEEKAKYLPTGYGEGISKEGRQKT